MLSRPSQRKKRPTPDSLDGYENVAVRMARSEDESAIRRVAELDGKPAPAGDALVAEADSEIIAAVPLNAGQAVADPFRRTVDVVALMELRAERLAVGYYPGYETYQGRTGGRRIPVMVLEPVSG